MKLLFVALAFVGAAALACPADDVKDAQASPQDKAAAEAKAPAKAPATKAVASKKAQTTKVADKAAAEAMRKSSL